VREPRVFLMDEPLSNLDAKLRIEMRAEIVKLCRRLKITTFYVTHDQIEALTMGHRIVVMKSGIAQQIGAPQEIYDRPANMFVAGFIGSPPMNFLKARVDEEGRLVGPGFELQTEGAVRTALRQQTGEVVAGICPEHLQPEGFGPGGGGGLTGRIEINEPLGSQVMIQVAKGDELVTAQFESGPELNLGDTIRLVHRPGVVQAFDPLTERSVIAGPARQPAKDWEAA
jgi:multiple sugar transport system ATP-binding protein